MLPHDKFKTLKQVVNYFSTELKCHQYLAGQRWNGLMTCPYAGCKGEEAYIFKDGIRYKCKCCKRLYTAKTGTVFEGTKLPLQDWLIAIYLIMHKKGVSSVQLSKDLGVTQKTAWFMLQRIRTVLGYEPYQQLDGIVEIDETFVGGKAEFKHKSKRIKYTKEERTSRGLRDKTPVMGFLQRGGKVQATVIPNVSAKTLRTEVMCYVKPGAHIMGDGYVGYSGLTPYYKMENVSHSSGWYVNGNIHTNTIEGFWSQLKKGLKSTYHQVSPKHLDLYVQEFVFKYNYRNLDIANQLDIFISNMNCRVKYKDLIRSVA